jgi:molybdopterin-containing oxidoreductase family iron-sulfur binding subunit
MSELDRRDFLKLVSASAGAAAAAGCSEPVEKLIPYVIQPEEITPGIAVSYASTCHECPAGCGLHVRTRESRPIKLEGNPDHPINRGRLCARGQAGIGRTYHPDRYVGPMRRDAGGAAPLAWDGADGAVALLASRIRETRAAGRQVVLLGSDRGPTANRWIDAFCDAAGVQRVLYEPLGFEAMREASRVAFGVASEPVFDLSDADLVIDFGGEFLESGPSPTENARQWADAKDLSKAAGREARLVYVGPRLSLTGSSADEWLPARPGTEGILALALARVALENGAGDDQIRGQLAGLLRGYDAKSAAERTGVDADTIDRLGRALAGARAAVAIPPGPAVASRRAVAHSAAVLILDHVVGATGDRVKIFSEGAGARRYGSHRDSLALIDAMKSGRVGVLLIHDVNPAYSLPAAAGFREALADVPFVVSLASAADETSELAQLVMPDHTPLESWGDAETRPGVRSLVQPTLRPLFDTRSLVDTLLDTGRALSPEIAARLPSGSLRGLLEEAWGGGFRRALARGGRFRPIAPMQVSLVPSAARIEVTEPLLDGEGGFALLAFPTAMLGDGSGANLPWMQEVPDPVTKVAWESWAEISNRRAEKLGISIGDVVAVETPTGRLEVPAYPRGGIRDDVIAIAMGQGHSVGRFATHFNEGLPDQARGVSVLDVLPVASNESGGPAWFVANASVIPTGSTQRLPLVQTHDNKRGRMLGESISLLELARGGEAHAAEASAAAGGHSGEHGSGHEELLVPYEGADDAAPGSPYRWGMSIDLDRCTGCSACVVACYIENNLPVVGEAQTLHGRQMSWIRIERYVGPGEPTLVPGRPLPRNNEELGNTDVRNSPMLCQQCGAAPCEPVCPVIATFHNDEGINGMVYNRCVGTRYCSNNCPYKVRRFNYYDYARETASDGKLRYWPEPMPLMLNPDVTVRGQGVMEKCSFCVQRIHNARQGAKDEAREIRDGEVTSACAQTCPSEAITFGNLRDPESRVSEKSNMSKQAARGYHALWDLNTRPAITYHSKVRRGPVEG